MQKYHHPQLCAEQNCELTEIHSYIEEPFNISSTGFDAVFDSQDWSILYVPAGTKVKYEATDGWKEFKNIVEMGSEGGALKVNDAFTVNGVSYYVKSVQPMEVAVGVYHTSDNIITAVPQDTTGTIVIPSTVTAPDGNLYTVTSVGYQAFRGCANINSVSLPESITEISPQSFTMCVKLSAINIPNSVNSIGYNAFMNCNELHSVTLPNSITSIGFGAFGWCLNLLEVYSYIEEPFAISSGGMGNAYNPFDYNREGLTLYVPAGTKALYEATDGWKEFKNIVEMGESEWEKYGIFTFDGIDYCIEDGEAFVQFVPKDITGRVVIPSTVSAPDRKAYSVTAIGYVAFKECIGITEIVLPNTIVEICDEAFVRCTGLNSIEIPNSVVSIGKDAFYNCAYLKSIEIPNSVITIGNGAFEKCGMLSAVTIGQSVKAIGARAFYDIKSSGKLISLIPEPFIIDNSVFTDLFKGIAQLYVPAGTKALYEATEGWKDFKNIVEMVNIDPIEGETTVNTESLNGQDLSDNVVDDVYYNTGDGSYDATDGSIVIGETTNMGQITNAVPGSDDVKNNFTGIILKVAAGKGIIKVNVKTSGNAQLVVQVGNATPMIASKTEQGDVVVSYDVEEDTYVYIYAIIGSSASTSMRASSTDEVRIYGFTVSPGASGVKAVWANEDSKAQIFSLDGKPLNEPQKGVNIVRMSNGQVRKVVVK